MKCVVVPVTHYQQNCSVLICEATGKAAVVDPGGDLARIVAVLQQHQLTLEKVFLTHAHMDHCAIADDIRQQFAVPIEGPHKDDQFWLDQLPQWCEKVGFPPGQVFSPDRWLQQGDTVSFGEQQLQVLHCPGHTPGHVVFYHAESQLAWVGDVLFKGSIGRTDFPRGNREDLLAAIKTKLWPLGDAVTFVPGHGPSSTFGEERRSNPFVADKHYG
ncbi:MBL fold metallo-hydrolase [Dasania sp. GY-MA-18]|uniref:MBL fold metallo-hydrolase n=1 Tax=Dasania phycosphaerae TaxID=2950436 RepID=A0A9J6RIT2_9GAMM|nr:MBL fold metallo-hydrolase [Dasania sp. GY-MA-18]MCZ0864160.1 MBL fold metallo-hydrolase [Dasania phycosphaerae]MCZ0867888.1 MBL fold metallo-hydrolase [Dasania phycosphaerae]